MKNPERNKLSQSKKLSRLTQQIIPLILSLVVLFLAIISLNLTIRSIDDKSVAVLDSLFALNLLFAASLIFALGSVITILRQFFSKRHESEAKEALLEQSELLNLLFENIPLGISVRNKEGLLLFSNSEHFRITGYSPDEIYQIKDWFEKAYPDPDYRQTVIDEWEKSKHKPNIKKEFTITSKGGEKKDIEFRISFLPDGRALAVQSNITDRKQAEKTSHNFSTAVSHSSDAIGMATPEGKHWYQNKAFDELFGKIGEDPPSSLYVDETVGRDVFETIMGGDHWIGEVKMYNKDRNILDILLRAYPIRNEKNQVVGLVGAHTDISQQKQAEKALLASEKKYRAVVENTPDLLYRTDLEGKITFLSKSSYELSGYTVDEAIGMKMAEEVYAFPDERQEFLDALRANGSVRNFQARLKRKDGSIWWASTNAHFFTDEDGNVAGVEGITRDITDNKKAESALKESEERFKIAGKLSYDLIYEWNPQENQLYWFGDVDTFLGYEPGSISSDLKSWFNLIHPDDQKRVNRAITFHQESVTPVDYEYRILKKDGTWRYWVTKALPQLDENGEAFKWVGVCTDITEKKESEDAIRENEQRMRAILEASPDPMVLYDKNGFPQYLSPSFSKVFGWKLSELKGARIPFVPEDEKEKTAEKIRETYSSNRVVQFETKRLTKDGKVLNVFLSAAVSRGKEDQPDGMVVNLTDITERKVLEAQYEQAQKMESLGTLAGGIAHDFNNLLGGIFGYLDIARKKVTDPKIENYLSKAFSASERAESLTRQLLTFSKGGVPIKKVEPLIPFLQETTQFALSGSNVSCSFNLPDDLWSCDYDRNQIGQVVDNIIINAQQAMPSGGKIEVSAANLEITNAKHPSLESGNYVKITIIDSGIGIPQKFMSKIFDPFFSTKQTGSGLGLATAYSIVKKHNGLITVNSELEIGTTFNIYLPAATTPDELDIPIIEQHYEGSGSILIMDDDEMLQKTLFDMLDDMGFSTTITSEGESALKEFNLSRERNTPFKAIILDLTIRGGMGGKDTIAEIRKIDKDIPVFVVSGYSEDDAIANPGKYGFTDSMKKPFTIGKLTELLVKHL